jgi:hypothetical protein
MRKTILTTALLVLIAGPAALAQGGGSSTVTKKPGTTTPSAPVGHRQPRAADVADQKSLSEQKIASDKEDAALDRKIRSICRGC